MMLFVLIYVISTHIVDGSMNLNLALSQQTKLDYPNQSDQDKKIQSIQDWIDYKPEYEKINQETMSWLNNTDLNQVIITKHYVDHHNPKIQGQALSLSLNDHGLYVLHNEEINVVITTNTTNICYDFDYYNSTVIILVCIQGDQSEALQYILYKVHWPFEKSQVSKFYSQKIEKSIYSIKLQMTKDSQYPECKTLNLTQIYKEHFINELLVINDSFDILIEESIGKLSSVNAQSLYSDGIYVTVNEIFKRSTAILFDTKLKWEYSLDESTPPNFIINNNEFEKLSWGYGWWWDIVGRVINSKAYIGSNYYVGFALLYYTNYQKGYELSGYQYSSQSFRQNNFYVTKEPEVIECFTFDYYSMNHSAVLCGIKGGQESYYIFEFRIADMFFGEVVSKIQIKPQMKYKDLSKVKLQIVEDSDQPYTKYLYIAVPAYDDKSKKYAQDSVIERYIMNDQFEISFESIIDAAFVNKVYDVSIKLSIIDFVVLEKTIYILNKDLNQDLAYVYKIPDTIQETYQFYEMPQQIELKWGKRAFFDVQQAFIHIIDFSTKLDTFIIAIFTEDFQQFSYGSQIMPVLSSIKYQDNGSNIIGKVTQNYKLILDIDKRTLQVQNLYNESYEKLMTFDKIVFGLLVDQPNDSFIIVSEQGGQRYFIQDPYFEANPKEATDPQNIKITATSADGQKRMLELTYQAIAKKDQNLYRVVDVLMPINMKFQTNQMILFQGHIGVSGSNPTLEFQKCSIAKLDPIFYTTNNVLLNQIPITAVKHIVSQFNQVIYMLIETGRNTQYLLKCAENVCNEQADFSPQYAQNQYQFSQSNKRVDFGVLHYGNELIIYKDKEYFGTISTYIRQYLITGQYVIALQENDIVYYEYSNTQDLVQKYIITSQYMKQVFDKSYEPKQIYANYALSKLLLILNANPYWLIIGSFYQQYSYYAWISCEPDTEIQVIIHYEGFTLLQYGPNIQKVSRYAVTYDQRYEARRPTYQLIHETLISDYAITGQFAYDIETSIFVISAKDGNSQVLLLFDPNRLQRDQLFRVIQIKGDKSIVNLQVVSLNDKLFITGLIDEKLIQITLNTNGYYLKAELQQGQYSISSQSDWIVQYKNRYSNITVDQQVNIEYTFNKIYIDKTKEIQIPKLEQSGQLILFPSDQFYGNVQDYILYCQQCEVDNPQIYLRKPFAIQKQQIQIGQADQCILDDTFFVCINISTLRTIDFNNQIIGSMPLNNRGIWIYRLGSTSLYLITLTNEALIYDIQNGIIGYKGSSFLLAGYKDQLTYFNNKIISFHYNQEIRDGYQIIDLQNNNHEILKVNSFTPLNGISSFAYDEIENHVVSAIDQNIIIIQKLDLPQQTIGDLQNLNIQDCMNKQGINIIDLKITYLSKVLDHNDIFLIYDIDGTGYKFDIKTEKILNIYPSPNNIQGTYNSVQTIGSEIVVVNKEINNQNQLFLYNFQNTSTDPNNNPSLLIQALKIKNKIAILRKVKGQSILYVQNDLVHLDQYMVRNYTEIVIGNKDQLEDQVLEIALVNEFDRITFQVQLEKSSKPMKDYYWIYIVISVAAVLTGSMIGYYIYRRRKQSAIKLLD